ncbi:MAG TPA: M14 family zinc carboxypeptidase, partial [Bacteroidales bacterium]|nr:M14 family zinc carboxypeptidase [Bacteroidales bacterium]
KTHENRPLYLMAITSPENQERLEQIRQAHLDYIYGRNTDYVDQKMPVIVWLGYSVHGNESTAGNASMLTAYYLGGSQSEEVLETLDNAVILIDPVLNPDGFNRAAQWSNMHLPSTQTRDYRHRQFREDWPGGRTNHYWFDLNRDWMPAQHPESKFRLKAFHLWKPHIVTDHHEMGSNSTFFFQPGEPNRVNPITPDRNYTLTGEIGRYHARALDDIGSLYFTQEGFDDFYYGKGSTYPDVHGSIGILFEQARMMGQVLDNDHGELTFAQGIRNQFTVSLSTIRGAMALRDDLNAYQHEFYSQEPASPQKDGARAYVFGAEHDPVKMFHFLEMLHHHKIRVHRLKEDVSVHGRNFSTREAFIVSLNQPQDRFIRSLFETRTTFEDSIFYDISTWTMPLAFNLAYASVDDERVLEQVMGAELARPFMAEGDLIGKTGSAGYMVRGTHYNLHKIIHRLQESDLMVKIATRSLTIPVGSKSYEFEPGAVFIPAHYQPVSEKKVHQAILRIAREEGVPFYAVETAFTEEGADLGSSSFRTLEPRRILLVAGEGTSSYSAGQVWHLLDHRFQLPVVMIKPSQLSRINLHDFNTVILPDGWYSWDEKISRKLKNWLQNGGVLVGLEGANDWLSKQKLIPLKRQKRPNADSIYTLPYNERGNSRRAQSINGVILRASIDPTHPIAYGIRGNSMPVFKDNNAIYSYSEDPYHIPVRIEESPLMSGYLSEQNSRILDNTPYCLVTPSGRGSIISFTADPNFRAFWYGTNKLFMNALFYGELL